MIEVYRLSEFQAFLCALMILIVVAIIAWIISSVIQHFKDRSVAKRLWEEHLSERGGKQ